MRRNLVYQMINNIIEMILLIPLSITALVVVLTDGLEFSYKKQLTNEYANYLFYSYLAYILVDVCRMYTFPNPQFDARNYFQQGFAIAVTVAFFITGWFGKVIAFYISVSLTTVIFNMITLFHLYRYRSKFYHVVCMLYVGVYISHRLVFGTYVAFQLVNSVTEWNRDDLDPPWFNPDLGWVKIVFIAIPLAFQVVNFAVFCINIGETVKKRIRRYNHLIEVTRFRDSTDIAYTNIQDDNSDDEQNTGTGFVMKKRNDGQTDSILGNYYLF